MRIILMKQVDGKVNAYVAEVHQHHVPPQFASETHAFRWLLCQRAAQLVAGDTNWREDTNDAISGEYEVHVIEHEDC